MEEGFTEKEILIRILDKIEKMEENVSETHALAISTNGKVRLHQKLIFTCFGALSTLTFWTLKVALG